MTDGDEAALRLHQLASVPAHVSVRWLLDLLVSPRQLFLSAVLIDGSLTCGPGFSSLLLMKWADELQELLQLVLFVRLVFLFRPNFL